MNRGYILLIAFAITALSAGAAKSTQADDQHLNELLWLKRLVGVPMLLLGAAYGYWTYTIWDSDSSLAPVLLYLVRGAGWALWGMGLSQRIVIDDASTLDRIAKAWSNQQRSSGLWLGFLTILGHTIFLVHQFGTAGLRFDVDLLGALLKQVNA